MTFNTIEWSRKPLLVDNPADVNPNRLTPSLPGAVADEESGEESGEDENGPVDDSMAAAGDVPPEQSRQDVRRGVNELENAPDNVHYAAAIAALVRFDGFCTASHGIMCQSHRIAGYMLHILHAL